MRIDSFIALRFLRAKRHDRTVSVITWISMVGVMLGVTALIITISVMNGFRENLFIAISGNTPHLRVLEAKGEMSGEARKALLSRLAGREDIVAAGPYLSRQAFLEVGGEFRAVLLRGIDPKLEAKLTELPRFLSASGLPGDAGEAAHRSAVDGAMERLTFPPPAGQRSGILLGAPLARSLGLLPGDEVRVISPVQRMTPIGPVPLMKTTRSSSLM